MMHSLDEPLAALLTNKQPGWKGIPGKNTLAYLAYLAMTMGKKFHNIDTWFNPDSQSRAFRAISAEKKELGITKGGSITVLLTSCLTGLESAVWQLTIFVFTCKTD